MSKKYVQRCDKCYRKWQGRNKRYCIDCGKHINKSRDRCWSCYTSWKKKETAEKEKSGLFKDHRKLKTCPRCGIMISTCVDTCRKCFYKYKEENHRRSYCGVCGIEIRYRKKYCEKHSHDVRSQNAKDRMSTMWQCPHVSKPQKILYEIIRDIDETFFLEYEKGWHPITVTEKPFSARKPDIVSYFHKIVIEFDGGYWHGGNEFIDTLRDCELNRVGYTVLHFNEKDLNNPKDIRRKVKRQVKEYGKPDVS